MSIRDWKMTEGARAMRGERWVLMPCSLSQTKTMFTGEFGKRLFHRDLRTATEVCGRMCLEELETLVGSE